MSPGEEVVLIGRQADQAIRAEEWAARLGTITYEVLCAIGPRVPRVYLGRPGDTAAAGCGAGRAAGRSGRFDR